VASALSDLDRWVDGRHDVELRDIGHAMNILIGPRGYRWMSHRLLTRIDMGELCRVTARGRGAGKGRTLYFKPWASRYAVLRELDENKMPLAAVHAAERFLEAFAQRVLFRRKNVTHGERHSLPQGEALTRKDGPTGPRQFFLAPRGSPTPSQPSPALRLTPRRDTALSRHGERLRRLRDEMEGNRHG
jgi:hypothetical protein